MSLSVWCVIVRLALGEPASPSEQPLATLPDAEHDEARARVAWDEGAAAFAAGRLDEAIERFELTYRYSGRPGPLFSLGQAHRHLWEKTKDDRHRRLALQRYRQYLEVDPEGRRKLEAERWIGLLEDELEDLGDPPPVFTRLGITSTTPGARVSIDGGAALQLPVTPDVAPGRHVVIVSAASYRSETREVDLPEGSTLPLAFELDPIDAELTVRGPAGAELWLDGQRVARLPTRGPVALVPGPHQIGVAQRGRTLFVRELELGRAQRERIDASLERTGQRKVAIATIAVGASATVSAAVLMALAFDQQRRARDVQHAFDRADHGISGDRFAERDRALERRDGLRTAAIATGVTGLAVLATGVLLWITDRPPVASQLHRPRVRPVIGRGVAGATLEGVF